jgi:hypothetical protein
MNNIASQLLKIFRNVVMQLRNIAASLLAIQKQIESISKQQQAQNQRQQSPPILRAELQIPEAVERDWLRG